MFLWFVGGAVVIAWLVFRSPALDYRLVALGAVLPVVDGVFGDVRVLHTLVACVLALGLVMVVFRGRRLVQRRWLGVPIGLFLHLVLDFVWTDAALFWWPFFGVSGWRSQLPEVSRGGLSLSLELVGAGLLLWFWRASGAGAARTRFVRTGHLPR